MKTTSDAAKAMAAIVAVVAAGNITLGEAAELAKLVETFVKAVEHSELNDHMFSEFRSKFDSVFERN